MPRTPDQPQDPRRLAPPRIAARLLARALPERERDAILGDLEEVYGRMARAGSRHRARRWYWTQAARLGLAFARERRVRSRSSRRSWASRRRLGGWSGDLRLAVRLAGRNPWLTGVAVCSLGAAMALVIVGFTLVWPHYGAPLPFEEPGRIVAVLELDPRSADDVTPLVGVLQEWRRSQTSFERLAAHTSARREIGDLEGGSRRFRIASVTASAFEVARVPAMLGRTLRGEDETPGAAPVIVLGQRAWRTLFAAAPDAVGRTLEIDGVARTVVGVMPEGYRWPVSEDLWIPLDLSGAASDERIRWLRVFGRLAPGVSAEQAATELDAIRRAWAAANPPIEELAAHATRVVPYVRGAEEPGSEKLYLALFVFFVLVLLVACASVSNLLMTRASARTGELAVRAALGATRRRLVGQLFVEALVLAAGGALIGLGIAHAALIWFDGFVQVDMRPFWIEFEVSGPAVVCAALAAFVAAAAAGVGPALRATGHGGFEVLADAQGRATGVRFGRFSGALTVLEVTLSVAFLAGAALAAKSFVEIRRAEVAYPASSVLTASLRMSDQLRLRATAGGDELSAPERAIAKERWPEHQERVARAAAELAGSRGAALATSLPGDQHPRTRVELEATGHAGSAGLRVFTSSISPGLFELLDAPVLAGSDFDAREAAGAERVAIVNASFVRDVLRGRDAVGRRFRPIAAEHADDGAEAEWLRIVGVVPDLGMNPGNRQRQAGYYTPLVQDDHDAVQIAVRAEGDPLLLSRPLREETRGIDPRLDLGDFATLADLGAQFLVVYEMMALIFVGVGAMALLLAVAGLYSVIAISVTRRTREIGLRVALGARPLAVIGAILGRGMRQVAIGLVLGSIAGLGVLELLSVFPIDFASGGLGLLVAVALAMLVAGAAACIVPASRSLRLHPVEALRHD